MPEMPNKRGSHMSAVLGDDLYVMGGWDSEKYLDYRGSLRHARWPLAQRAAHDDVPRVRLHCCPGRPDLHDWGSLRMR